MVFSLILLAGCNKEKFPDQDQIIGKWMHTSSAQGNIRIEFKSNGLCFYQASDTAEIDTLIYQLKIDDERLWFGPISSGIYQSHHQIKYNVKDDRLTIWGLTTYSLSGNSSVHTFIRE